MTEPSADSGPSSAAEPSAETGSATHTAALAIGGLDGAAAAPPQVARPDRAPLFLAGLGTLLLMAAFLADLAGSAAQPAPVVLLLLATAVQWGAGLPLHAETWGEVRARRPGPAVLLTVATGAGWADSVWRWIVEGDAAGLALAPIAALLIFLTLLGRQIVSTAHPRAKGNAVVPSPPAMARRRAVSDPVGEEVPVESLPVGATLILRPGDIVPVDATVVSGAVEVLSQPVTGDPLPRTCQQGVKILAGSRVISGMADIRAEESGVQSILGEIAALSHALPKRRGQAPREEVRVARWCLAVALMLGPVFAFAGGLQAPARGLHILATVFLLSYPAGFAFYRPLSRMFAARLAKAGGLRLHDLEAPFRARQIAHMVVGWRGLITAGRMSVGPVRTEEGVTEPEALSLARAVVGRTDHPLADCLAHAADNAGGEIKSGANRLQEPGRGYTARVENRTLLLGTPSLLAAHRVGYRRFSEQADAWLGEGYQVWWLAEAEPRRRTLAVIAVGDKARRPVLQSLQALKVDGVGASVSLPLPEGDEASLVAESGVGASIAGRPHARVEAMEAARRERGPTALVATSVADLALTRTADLVIAPNHAAEAVKAAADITLPAPMPDRSFSALTWAKRYAGRAHQVLWGLLALNGFFMFLVPVGLFFPLFGLIAAGLSIAGLIIGLLTLRP